MTAFIFMLTPGASDAEVHHVMAELATTFPEHDFVAGGADFPDLENSIMAIHGSAGSIDEPGTMILPNEAEVEEVKLAFQQLLDGLREWKPS
jgi:hypothetical protein